MTLSTKLSTNSSATAFNSPEDDIVLSLSSKVTLAADLVKLPALVPRALTVKLSLPSNAVSVNMGNGILTEVNPARMVTLWENWAAKSVSAVALSEFCDTTL